MAVPFEVSSQTLTCPHCYSAVEEGNFCTECGNSLHSKHCDACKHEVPVGDFCCNCSAPLVNPGVTQRCCNAQCQKVVEIAIYCTECGDPLPQ